MFNRLVLKILNFPTALKVRFYPHYNRWKFRLKGINYGNDLNILGQVVVHGKGEITIGDNFCMTSGNHINPICGNEQASIFTETSSSEIKIGDNVGMSSTRIWVHDNLCIGNNVQIGACVLIIDTDTHQVDYKLRRTPNDPIFYGMSLDEIIKTKEAGTKSAAIKIEDDVWIGAHSIVLKGVSIGARSIIGAGSIVTKDIPSDCIAAGNPCKVIRYINQ